ncbi:MAG TPA: YceH family protein [Pyrinomonadaceae bacterium]|nr:YceH family protein [Pyrinomonadaceae bacterium]
MTTTLSDIEVRVLGALVEKQVTTPEYYPLTLNSLTLACNQKNNRHPVTSYSENEVAQALETLREKNLTYVFHGSTSRVPKYKHVMPEVMHLSPPETALMCVLMLRGPQTIGELRGHGGRLHTFTSLEEVDATVNALITHDPDPMVVRLPRLPGQKEARFAQLFSGAPAEEIVSEAPPPRAVSSRQSDRERIEQLEQTVTALTDEIQTLKQQFGEFKKQFD